MATISNNIPHGYKATALGIIPQEWEVKRLGEICTYFKSGEGITSKDISENGQYPVYGGNGLRGYTDKKYTHDGAYILIGRQGALCGNINYVTDKCYISEHAIAVQAKGDLLWLRYKLDFWNLNRYSESSAQPGLSVEKLVRYKLTVPPMAEQRKIAEVLGVWDEAIEKQARLIEKLALRKRALMQRLLSAKLRLPGFSEPWQKVNYSDILKEVRRTLTWDENELYDLISVRRRSGGVFHRESLYGHEIKTKTLRPALEGDFLISKMQIVHGASGVVPKQLSGMKISGSYIALIAKDPKELNINYFNLWSQMPLFYHQTFVSSYGVHIEKMTFDLDAFMSLSMNLPPIEEQDRIVEIILTATNEIELAKEKLDRLRRQKRGLMQQLLTGKKRVKY